MSFYVICWQTNGGKNWNDYRGGTVRDDNTFLTEDSYVTGPKNAKRFNNPLTAVDFGKDWMKKNTSHQKSPVESVDGNKIILDYGQDGKVFGNNRLIIRPYRPRS